MLNLITSSGKMIFILLIIFKGIEGVSRTDFDMCKVTHGGNDYMGTISTTESGLVCEQWDTSKPTHVPKYFVQDEDFFDGKKSTNKNYCRNPKKMYDAPWCYTLSSDVIDEICNVPLCSFTECQISGIGAEYGGDKNTTMTRKNCLNWSETIYRKYEAFHGRSVTSKRYLLDNKFPDQSRKRAGNKCRNPTGDLNGPWCFIDTESETDIFQYDKDYCDIPFCNQPDCPVTTMDTDSEPIHYHFNKLPDTMQLTFSVQLWNPEDWELSTIYVALSCYPFPMDGQRMREINNGIELKITHKTIGFAENPSEPPSTKDYTGALSGLKFTKFILSWVPNDGYISVESPNFIQQPIITEYSVQNDTILGSFGGKFQYYSIMGGPVLWDFGSCTDDQCDEHITSKAEYFRFIKMKESSSGNRMIQFFLRTTKQAFVELRSGPILRYPTIKIEILNSVNITTISFLENNTALPVFLGDVKFNGIVTQHQWNDFSISVVNDRLQMLWIRRTVSQTVFNVKHSYFRDVRWIGISSTYAANWVFHCNQKDLPVIPDKLIPPECVYSTSSYEYSGTQRTTNDGSICLPWIHPKIQKSVDESKLPEKSFGLARNYCRNPTYNSKGPYCYVSENYDKKDSNIIEKFCSPPKCLDTECRLGNGETYNGNISRTATGRTCQAWNASSPFTIPKKYFNNTYANITYAANHCRNPAGSFSGPFCYTTDPKAVVDSCEIKECYMPNNCTVIFSPTKNPGRSILLKPEWLLDKMRFSVKMWEPGAKIANIAFIIKYRKSPQFFTLNVGNSDGDQINLVYTDEHGAEKTLKSHLIPLIIPLGSWRGLWLQFPPNTLEFGFEDEESNPIFTWSSSEDSSVLYEVASYVTVVILNTFYIGINFPPSYCIIEKVETDKPTVIYHANVWDHNDTLTVYVMTETDNPNGQIIVSLFPWLEREYRIYIGRNFIKICIHQPGPEKCNNTEVLDQSMFNKNSWTSYFISTVNDTTLEVRDWKKKLLAFWTPDFAVYFYYFSVSAMQFNIFWSANCKYPIDIYAEPINGGWGEFSGWTCNVPCGRGIGYKTRECNNPVPNILGKPCAGSSKVSGVCNEFACGTFSPEVLNNTAQRKTTMNHTVYVEEYGRISLSCYSDIIMEMKNQSPNSEYEWLKNGFPVPNTRFYLQKLTLENALLNLYDARINDSGLYICIIRPSYTIKYYEFLEIKIISFIVTSNSPTEYHRETTSMHLYCNSPILQLFYTDLVQLWTINDLLYLDYGPAEFSEIDNDEVDIIEKYHAGVWTCIVEQRALNLTWVTAWKKVEVLPAPTWISYISEEDAPRLFLNFLHYYPNVIKGILITIVIVIIILVGLLDYHFIKWRQELLHGL